MNSRLQALIDRGYPEKVVMTLATFTDEDLNYASDMAFKHICRNCNPVDNPEAIFIGGQPGSGKSVLSAKIKDIVGNAVEIGIDNYRMYHPNYLEIEKCINEFWKDKKETENDSKGNDIADFTHWFAGAMTDKLIEFASNYNYNLILEWGMREPKGPLKTMSDLTNKDYNNTVVFVAAYKDLSYEACKLRASKFNGNHIIRKVPKYFHDLCVDTLPESINEICSEGYKNNFIKDMYVVNRKGEIVWNKNSEYLPGKIFDIVSNDYRYSFGYKNDPNLAIMTNNKETQGINNSFIYTDLLIEKYLDKACVK